MPPYPGTPRWVKLSAIIVGALILIVVVVLVTGLGGRHGPGRHKPTAESENSQAQLQHR